MRLLKTKAMLFSSIPFVLVFVSCGTLKPMTKNVMSDVGGITAINKFQYFVSANIELTATEVVKESDFNKQGSVKVKEIAYRDIIKISAFTMGVLMDSHIDETDGTMILEVCFEEKESDSDKRILFKQAGLASENKYFVVYSDPRRDIIKYGDRDYSLTTRTGERVFLKINIDRKKIEKERIRRAKGRKVQY